MNKIAIIVDAACDLPLSFIIANNILIVSFHIRTEQGFVRDDRNEAALPSLYRTHLVSKSEGYAQSMPLKADELESFFLNKVVTQYDEAIFLTIAASRSNLNQHIDKAWFNISTKCFKLRRDLGLRGGFQLRLVDTTQIGPGQAVLAYYANALLKQGLTTADIVQRLLDLRQNIFGYGVPNDLLYLYTRAKAKNEDSITWTKYFVGSMLSLRPIIRFNYGESQVTGRVGSIQKGLKKITTHLEDLLISGLKVPVVCMSYSGALADMSDLTEYAELKSLTDAANVLLMLVPMSLTVAVNFGGNALLIAFAAHHSELS